MEGIEWRRHPQHGFMLRGPVYEVPGFGNYRMVITSLFRDNLKTEMDHAAWQAQNFRLCVNAGSGQISCEEMADDDINEEFVVISEAEVPEHIRADFLAMLNE